MTTAARVEEGPLAQECIEWVRALPFVRRATLRGAPKNDATFDARLTIVTPEGRFDLPCELKRTHLRRETAQAVVHRAQRHPGLMLFAPAIGREVGEAFEEARVNFVDVAGNCHVRLGDRYLARIQGRTAPEHTRTERGLRAPAYRALFTLLVRPGLIDAPSRTLASEAEVSPQTANELRNRLVEQQIVVRAAGHHHWAPGRRNAAVTLWLGGFSASLVPSLVIGRFRAKESDPAALERRIEPELDAICNWRYGGGAAAQRLTGFYRGERTLLYIDGAAPDLSRRLRFVPDATGSVVLARAPGKLAFESPDPRCVHPLLAYADLLAEGHERAHEAAGVLHERFLAAAERAP